MKSKPNFIAKFADLLRSWHPWTSIFPPFLGSALYFIFRPHFTLSLFFGMLFCFFIFDNLGVQIGVHKLLAHRAFKCSVGIRRLLIFFSALSGQGSPLFWAAVHMGSHHPSYDSDKDIHSPIHGKFYAFLGWYWQMDPKRVSFVTVREYFPDKTLMFIHKNHNLLLMSYWIFLSFWGLDQLVYFGFLPAAFSISLVGLVNSLLHSDGRLSKWLLLKYKTYDDPSTFNSVPLGILTMGLGLHNNHHHNQSKAVYSEKWFEIDFSKWIIPIFATSTRSYEVSDLTSSTQK